MTIRVALYADPESRVECTDPETSAIARMYRGVFGSKLSMSFATAASVRSGMVFEYRPHIFILPGVLGEKSFYPEHFGPEGYDHTRRFLENGGVLDAYCAGAYDATPEILWGPSWGTKKMRMFPNTLGVIAAKSFGPVGNYCQPVPEGREKFFEGWHRVDPVPIILDTGERIKMAYGFGPAFEIEDYKNVNVRARYAEVAGEPPAIIDAPYGRGHVFLHGTLPQYTHMHREKGNLRTDFGSIPKTQSRLLRALYKHRLALAAFANSQLKRMAAHHGL